MANIFNKIDSLGLDYKLEIKEYDWFNHEKVDGKYKTIKGLHILIPINDRFTFSIIHQQNECTGEFYEDDDGKWQWELAIKDDEFKCLWDIDKNDVDPTRFFVDGVVHFLDEDEVIELVSKFYNELHDRI